MGKSCFHYIKEFDLYKLLNTDLLQELIDERWNGKLVLTATIPEFSTAFLLFQDKHGLFSGAKMYKQLKDDIFNFDQKDKRHIGKFTSWQKSMKLRNYIESFFIFVLTIFFQVYIGQFNQDLHKAQDRLPELVEMYKSGNNNTENYFKLIAEDIETQEKMGDDLFHAQVLSWISLFFLPT